MKGVSPLIAAVLLIAFTMAIAGFVGTWGTTFLTGKSSRIGTEAECINVLDISSLKFSNGVISFKMRNTGKINITGLRTSLEYSDPSNNKEYLLKNFGVPDPLSTLATQTVLIDTSESCTSGTRNCDTGNNGICANGIQVCSGGTLGLCLETDIATAEICDGLDNNCDGIIDEGCSSIKNLTVKSEKNKDGYSTNSDFKLNQDFINIGKDSRNKKRGYLFFDTALIEDEAYITKAKLTIYGVNMANCQNTGKIDLINCKYDPLDTSDFNGCLPGPSQNTGAFLDIPKTGGKQFISTNIGTNFIDKTASTQFKLVSQNEGCGGQSAYARICMDSNGADGCDIMEEQPTLEVIYEHECNNNQQRNCDTGQEGICMYGIQICSAGKWGTCTPENNPINELCDGLDNDCNGEVDNNCGVPEKPIKIEIFSETCPSQTHTEEFK